jgi:transcriptional regulator with XRE-family HTH domain
MPPEMLGKNLRTLRQKLGRSLTDVAEATGLSPSFLSMVENGNSDIALGRLLRVTQYYGVEIADVVPGQAPPPDHQVIHADERQHFEFVEEGLDVQFLAEAHHLMRPLLVKFRPGGGMVEPVRDAGDAFLYMLVGEVEVSVDGTPLTLKAGDSTYLPAEQGRLFRNQTDAPAVLLSVVVRLEALEELKAG